jgi:Putative zinc-finger
VTVHCDDLDTFFDGELAADRAAEFRDHLASCPRCQEALRGRMLEAAVVADAKPSSGAAIDELAPRRSRRRWGAVTAGLAAVAAAAAVVWFVQRPGGDLAETGVVVERGDRVVRSGDITVGDTIHATARGYRAIWIYRDDRELVLTCPGGPTCRTIEGGVAADLKIPSVGGYAIVMLDGDKLPAPHSSLDEDVAAALDAGAKHRIEQLQVR